LNVALASLPLLELASAIALPPAPWLLLPLEAAAGAELDAALVRDEGGANDDDALGLSVLLIFFRRLGGDSNFLALRAHAKAEKQNKKRHA
jgi:hypothetical protein